MYLPGPKLDRKSLELLDHQTWGPQQHGSDWPGPLVGSPSSLGFLDIEPPELPLWLFGCKSHPLNARLTHRPILAFFSFHTVLSIFSEHCTHTHSFSSPNLPISPPGQHVQLSVCWGISDLGYANWPTGQPLPSFHNLDLPSIYI